MNKHDQKSISDIQNNLTIGLEKKFYSNCTEMIANITCVINNIEHRSSV